MCSLNILNYNISFVIRDFKYIKKHSFCIFQKNKFGILCIIHIIYSLTIGDLNIYTICYTDEGNFVSLDLFSYFNSFVVLFYFLIF